MPEQTDEVSMNANTRQWFLNRMLGRTITKVTASDIYECSVTLTLDNGDVFEFSAGGDETAHVTVCLNGRCVS